MSSAQKCVQSSLPRRDFSRAPLRSALASFSHDDRIAFLIFNDRDAYARKAKLRSLLSLLTPRQKAYFIACNTR